MTNHRENGGVVSHAALKAGMHRQTAAHYLKKQAGPEQCKEDRGQRQYRTRPDPLAGGGWGTAPRLVGTPPERRSQTPFLDPLGGGGGGVGGGGRGPAPL